MTYHAARNNQQLGAFAKEDLLARYNRGEILPTDLVWTDGMPAWQPASQILGAPAPSAATPSPDTPPPMPPPITGIATPMHGGAYGVPPANTEPCPSSNMALAVVATVLGVLFCWLIALPLGIIAIVMATQVQSKYEAGNIAGAKSSAKTSMTLSWISLALSILGLVFVIVFIAMGAASGFRN